MSLHSEEIKSKQTFQYGNKTLEYFLIKSKRRKTCEVIVDKNGGEIVLRVPFEKTTEEIEKILNDKIKWAITKQKEYQNEIKEIVKPTFENNSTLPYMGKNYELQVVHYYYTDDNDNDDYNTENNTQNEKIVFMNSKFIAYLLCNSGDNDMEKIAEMESIRRLYNDWLCSEANKIFVDKVNQFSNKVVDTKPKRILVKNLKNRWGSVTKNQTINLNVNLMKAPEDVIDYIIIHELCHFKVKGHSYRFWDYLKQFVPDYKQKVEWLRRNSANLIS